MINLDQLWWMNCYSRKLYRTENCMLCSGSCLYHKMSKKKKNPIHCVSRAYLCCMKSFLKAQKAQILWEMCHGKEMKELAWQLLVVTIEQFGGLFIWRLAKILVKNMGWSSLKHNILCEASNTCVSNYTEE